MKKIVLLSGIAILALFSCSNAEEKFVPTYRTVKKADPKLSKFKTATIRTSMGSITISLHWDAAPETCSKFAALVKKGFYNKKIIFHRVIKNFMIQTGCPKGTGTGGPGFTFGDEINADTLGLDKIIVGKNRMYFRDINMMFRKIFFKKIQAMGIKSKAEYTSRKDEVQKAAKELQERIEKQLKTMSVKELYQRNGYIFTKGLKSKKALRGSVAMANSGPDTNGSQFFINVVDTPHLNGKHTVFGTVLNGMPVADRISKADADKNGLPKNKIRIVTITLQ